MPLGMRYTRKKKQEVLLKNSSRSRWQKSTAWGVVTRCVQETRKASKVGIVKLNSTGWLENKSKITQWPKRLTNMLKDGETSHAHGLEELVIENDPSTKSNLQVWCNPNTNSKSFFNRKSNKKCMWFYFYVFLFLKLDSQFERTHLTLSFCLICLNINFGNLIPLWMEYWLCRSDGKTHVTKCTVLPMLVLFLFGVGNQDLMPIKHLLCL